MKNDDAKWLAVLERDTNARFVYGARSTGVYCRPTCPSQKPFRCDIEFFDYLIEAEQAGYRACLRYIEEHPAEEMSLAVLSAMADLSPTHFLRAFKQMVGVSPKEYCDAIRIEQYKIKLKNGVPVTGALIDARYNSTSRLVENSNARLGMTPTSYKRGGDAMPIFYATAATSLGRLLVATTERGVCSVTLGDTDKLLVEALLMEYPTARVEQNAGNLADWISALVQHLEGKQPDMLLPLDVRATAFQQRVWQELQTIPYGETRSYSQVAEATGQPTCTRAVANACGQNPTALVVPCHRVVRNDGSIGGYRWGVERKKKLLQMESQACETR